MGLMDTLEVLTASTVLGATERGTRDESCTRLRHSIELEVEGVIKVHSKLLPRHGVYESPGRYASATCHMHE